MQEKNASADADSGTFAASASRRVPLSSDGPTCRRVASPRAPLGSDAGARGVGAASGKCCSDRVFFLQSQIGDPTVNPVFDGGEKFLPPKQRRRESVAGDVR
jgi:hypothetical protein